MFETFLPAQLAGFGLVEIVFFLVLAIYVLVGFVLFRIIDIPEDFYVMDRSAGSILIAGTLFASFMSATTMMGIAGIVYTEGAVMWLVIYGSWPGLVVGMLYIGRRFRALEDLTMPDYIGDRYQSEVVRLVATVVMMVGLIGFGVIQLIGAGYLLAGVLGIEYQTIVILFGGALLIFTVAGGMYSVVVTDTLMGVTMAITGLVLAPIAIYLAGGIPSLVTTLPAENPGVWSAGGANMNMPLGWLAGQWVLWFFFIMVAPWVVTRSFPASDDFAVLNGTTIATVLATVVITILFLGVTVTFLHNPGIDPVDFVVIWMAQELVHPTIGGLAIAGVMAGILSTTSTIFIYAGFGLSRDLFERVGGQVLSEQGRLLAARVAQIVVVVAVTAIALTEPLGIYWLGAWAGAIFAVTWAPMIIAGLEWENANKYGALASIVGGFTSYVVLYQLQEVWGTYQLPWLLDPVIPALIISVTLMIGVSLVTQTTEAEREFQRELERTELAASTIEELSPETLQRKYDRTKYLTLGLFVVGVIVYGFLMARIWLPLV